MTVLWIWVTCGLALSFMAYVAAADLAWKSCTIPLPDPLPPGEGPSLSPEVEQRLEAERSAWTKARQKEFKDNLPWFHKAAVSLLDAVNELGLALIRGVDGALDEAFGKPKSRAKELKYSEMPKTIPVRKDLADRIRRSQQRMRIVPVPAPFPVARSDASQIRHELQLERDQLQVEFDRMRAQVIAYMSEETRRLVEDLHES